MLPRTADRGSGDGDRTHRSPRQIAWRCRRWHPTDRKDLGPAARARLEARILRERLEGQPRATSSRCCHKSCGGNGRSSGHCASWPSWQRRERPRSRAAGPRVARMGSSASTLRPGAHGPVRRRRGHQGLSAGRHRRRASTPRRTATQSPADREASDATTSPTVPAR